MNLHVEYCNSFGVSKEDILASEESEGMSDSWRYSTDSADDLPTACTAYTRQVARSKNNGFVLIFDRYVLDVGHSEDLFALNIAMAPCLIGYGVIARRLYDDPTTKREGNIYWKWIETYVADDFAEAVRDGSGEWLIL